MLTDEKGCITDKHRNTNTRIILIDWIYRKDENYYPIKCFKKNIMCSNYDKECINLFLKTLKIRKKIWEIAFKKVSFWNIRHFLGLWLENVIIKNIRFFRKSFFIFWALKVTSWNIKSLLGSLFPKI